MDKTCLVRPDNGRHAQSFRKDSGYDTVTVQTLGAMLELQLPHASNFNGTSAPPVLPMGADLVVR
jgi:hypothetical protein